MSLFWFRRVAFDVLGHGLDWYSFGTHGFWIFSAFRMACEIEGKCPYTRFERTSLRMPFLNCDQEPKNFPSVAVATLSAYLSAVSSIVQM